jgi:hypothetical protein
VPLHPLVSRPDVIAISTGGAFFWLTSYLVLPLFIYTLNASFLYVTLTASGVIAGALARRSPLMHGLLLGLFVGILLASFPRIFLDAPPSYGASPLGTATRHVALAAVPGLFFCPLGALLAEGISNVRRGL